MTRLSFIIFCTLAVGWNILFPWELLDMGAAYFVHEEGCAVSSVQECDWHYSFLNGDTSKGYFIPIAFVRCPAVHPVLDKRHLINRVMSRISHQAYFLLYWPWYSEKSDILILQIPLITSAAVVRYIMYRPVPVLEKARGACSRDCPTG